MLQGFLVLLLFQMLGEALAALSGAPIPGPVIGMLCLFIALRLRGRASEDLQRTSQALIQHLSLLFLPAGVGIFFLPAALQSQWLAIGAAMMGGTLLTMLLSAALLKYLAGQKGTGT